MINTFNKTYKKLNKYYKTQLNKFNKENKWLDHLITYLCYLRDFKMISTCITDLSETDDIDVITLTRAIMEYELAQTCITQYYAIDEKGIAIIKDEAADKELIRQKYSQEKATHINLFWQIVATNIERWLEIDASNI